VVERVACFTSFTSGSWISIVLIFGASRVYPAATALRPGVPGDVVYMAHISVISIDIFAEGVIRANGRHHVSS
jgi:hypothetical protein